MEMSETRLGSMPPLSSYQHYYASTSLAVSVDGFVQLKLSDPGRLMSWGVVLGALKQPAVSVLGHLIDHSFVKPGGSAVCVEIVDKGGCHKRMHTRGGYNDANLISECEDAA